MKSAQEVLIELYEMVHRLRLEHSQCPADELNSRVLNVLNNMEKQVQRLEKQLEAAE